MPEPIASAASAATSSVSAAGTLDPVSRFGDWVIQGLTNDGVNFIVVPIIVSLAAIYLKSAMKPQSEPKPEDKVFGFDLGITACVTLLLSGLIFAKKQMAAPNVSALAVGSYVVGVFTIATLSIIVLAIAAYKFRQHAWITAHDGSQSISTKWLGAVNIGGISFLIAAFVLVGGGPK